MEDDGFMGTRLGANQCVPQGKPFDSAFFR
jgi:hypothetical protein